MGILFEKKLLGLLLFTFFVLEGIVAWPKMALFFSLALAIFFLLSLFFILKIRPKEEESYPIFILPVVLVLEASFVVNSIPSSGLKQLFLILACFLLYLVVFSLEAIKAKIESYAVIIFNILTIANLIAVFLGYVLLYDFYLLGSVSLRFGMIFIGLVTALYFLFTLWQNDLFKKRGNILLIVFVLLMIEFFWVVSLLPLIALQAGFLLFLFYYTFADLLVMVLKKNITRRKIINHITVPTVVLFFLLISAGW